jgi:elongation factor 1-gamma
MSQLRIFSYLPNPRIWKATIAARLTGVDVEIRGTSPKELATWLWDFDARPLLESEKNISREVRGRVGFKGSLHKSDAFLEAHPFGTVPAAFSSDGKVGIFESNSIMRAVARLGASKVPLYGRDPYEASRIDSFLDASLVFARDSQIYLLALGSEALSAEIHSRMRDAFGIYLAGINQALSPDREFIAGESLTLADICFVAELALFYNEKPRAGELEKRGLEPILNPNVDAEFPRAMAHFAKLAQHPAFAPDVVPYLEKIKKNRTYAPVESTCGKVREVSKAALRHHSARRVSRVFEPKPAA